LGHSLETIRGYLSEKFNARRVPSDRTIARRIAKYAPPRAPRWEWAGAEGDDFVLDCQTAAIQYTEGRAGFLTEEEAKKVKAVRGLVLMPPLTSWLFAKEWAATGDNAQHVVAGLGLARRFPQGVAEDAKEAIENHVAHHARRWLARPLMAWVRTAAAANMFVDAVGKHGSLAEWHWTEETQFLWFLIATGGTS
jgi:hypothetical protein